MSNISQSPELAVRRCRSSSDIAIARELFREYTSSIEHLCAASFAQQNIEQELRTLPGKYAEPAGCILLACGGRSTDGSEAEPIGCVALRPIEAAAHDRPGERVCEMKRLYTRPAARGLGAGRRLCEELIVFAREAGYTLIKLDTEPELAAACALYQALGFIKIPRYNDDPKPETLYLGLRLR